MMFKFDEIENKDSCLNRADITEMIFVLLARDIAAPETIRFWVRERLERGRNVPTDQQIIDALECAAEMEKQRGALVASIYK